MPVAREKECGKHFRFTLTTNGVLIDDGVIDFANREMSNVVLSLDGRKEVHDRYRVDYAGNGSWEQHRSEIPEARQGARQQGVLHARHIHARKPGFSQRHSAACSTSALRN